MHQLLFWLIGFLDAGADGPYLETTWYLFLPTVVKLFAFWEASPVALLSALEFISLAVTTVSSLRVAALSLDSPDCFSTALICSLVFPIESEVSKWDLTSPARLLLSVDIADSPPALRRDWSESNKLPVASRVENAVLTAASKCRLDCLISWLLASSMEAF